MSSIRNRNSRSRLFARKNSHEPFIQPALNLPGALALAVLKRGIIVLGRPETVYRVDGQAPIRPAPLPYDVPVINKLTGMMATGTPGSFVVPPEHLPKLLQGKELAVRFDIAGGSFRTMNKIPINGIANAVAQLDKTIQ